MCMCFMFVLHVFHVCFYLCVDYGVGVCVNVCGVVCVVECVCFLHLGGVYCVVMLCRRRVWCCYFVFYV